MTMTSDNLFDDIKKSADELAELRKAHIEKSQAVLKSAFKALFEKYPDVRAVVWCQYTPYFNDGEPCVFSVGDLSVLDKKGYKTWKDEDGSAWAAEEYAISEWNYNQADFNSTITKEQAKEIRDFISHLKRAIDDDVFEEMFGDHVEIVATRKGFEVTEFHHD